MRLAVGQPRNELQQPPELDGRLFAHRRAFHGGERLARERAEFRDERLRFHRHGVAAERQQPAREMIRPPHMEHALPRPAAHRRAELRRGAHGAGIAAEIDGHLDLFFVAKTPRLARTALGGKIECGGDRVVRAAGAFPVHFHVRHSAQPEIAHLLLAAVARDEIPMRAEEHEAVRLRLARRRLARLHREVVERHDLLVQQRGAEFREHFRIHALGDNVLAAAWLRGVHREIERELSHGALGVGAEHGIAERSDAGGGAADRFELIGLECERRERAIARRADPRARGLSARYDLNEGEIEIVVTQAVGVFLIFAFALDRFDRNAEVAQLILVSLEHSLERRGVGAGAVAGNIRVAVRRRTPAFDAPAARQGDRSSVAAWACARLRGSRPSSWQAASCVGAWFAECAPSWG